MMIGLILVCGLISYLQSGIGVSGCPSVDWQDSDNITTTLNLQVTCGENYIDVMINNTCILWQEGFNVTTDVTINGLSGVTQSCDDLEDVSSSSDDYWKKRIPQPFDNCGTKVKMDGNNITYRNALSVYQYANTAGRTIWRNKLIYLNFECRYPAKYQNLTLKDFEMSGIEVVQNPHNASALVEHGEFNYTVQGCFDEPNCDRAITPFTLIKICEPIYIIITTTRDVTIYIYRVLAFDRLDRSGDKHLIVDSGGCIQDTEEPFPATIDYSVTGRTVICIYSFQWANNPDRDLYFLVSFGFCDSNAGQTCNPPCSGEGSRRRRAIPYDSSQDLTTTMLGPWKVV